MQNAEAKEQRYAPEHVGGEPHRIETLISSLEPISLEKTNARASMQSRVDNKYLVDLSLLDRFIEETSQDYAVLEIDSKRQFIYRSCYYDDHYQAYLEHHQGRRQRIKVRTRHYVDGGGMKYFEAKLKGPRGITIKHREAVDQFMPERICGDQMNMLRGIYQQQYRKPLHTELKPSLIVGYSRCTLVAKESAERVTIDFHLQFEKPNCPNTAVRLGSNFIIVETKSAKGNGLADKALKDLRTRQRSSCSKYCIGVNLTGGVSKCNRFLPTFRHARRNVLPSTAKPNLGNPTLSLAS